MLLLILMYFWLKIMLNNVYQLYKSFLTMFVQYLYWLYIKYNLPLETSLRMYVCCNSILGKTLTRQHRWWSSSWYMCLYKFSNYFPVDIKAKCIAPDFNSFGIAVGFATSLFSSIICTMMWRRREIVNLIL